VAAGNHETSLRIVDAIFLAMKDVIPERLSSGGATTSGMISFSEPRDDGSWKMLYEVHAGGEGARHDRAGCAATRVHLTNTSNTPVEMIEANYNIRVEKQAIRWGSGGAGEFPGGDGVVRSYRVLAPSMHLTSSVERKVIAPFGLQGGEPGKTASLTLTRDGAVTEIDGKSNLVLQQDDVITIEMCGGGGYGPVA
jgi:N-methylhydantoinase B